MDTAQEVLAALRTLEGALPQAEQWRAELRAAQAGDPLAGDALAAVELLSLEVERLRREFAAQLAGQLRPD